MAIKVYNRSTGIACYDIPELNTHRVFNMGESKNIEESELEALFQMEGGRELIEDILLVDDKAWVASHFEAPIEYWWQPDRIKTAIIEDDLELFAETLDYAPEGVVDFIKYFSWKMPLTDLNKIKILQEKTGFDTLGAIEIMKTDDSKAHNTTEGVTRRRRREED